MTPREFHRRFSSFQQKIERIYLNPVWDVLKAEVDAFIARGMQAADINSINVNELIPIINKMYYQCGYSYGWTIYKQYKKEKAAPIEIETKDLASDILDIFAGALDDVNVSLEGIITPNGIAEEVMQMLRLSLMQNVAEMDGSVKRAILKKINEGYENGWNYEKTAQMLRDVASIGRARRIVRTESVKAVNASAMVGAKKTGLLMKKRWISARDNRVRGNPAGKYPRAQFDHWHVNGEVVGMDAHFQGTGEPMLYPGDPKGAAADVINCRCCASFTTVRDSRGRAIRVQPGFFSSRGAMNVVQ